MEPHELGTGKATAEWVGPAAALSIPKRSQTVVAKKENRMYGDAGNLSRAAGLGDDTLNTAIKPQGRADWVGMTALDERWEDARHRLLRKLPHHC